MEFEWDGGKAEINRRKHGVLFGEAETMIGPAIFEDFDHSEKESRYLAIGFSDKGRLLTVSFTRPRPGVCRIISARRATKQEQERYAKAKREAGEP